MNKPAFLALSFLFFQPSVFMDGSASPQGKSQQVPFQYEVSVTLKLIQVFVANSHGKPIEDLARSDFEIYDNAAPMRITEFEKHFLAVPAIRADGRESPGLQKAASSNESQVQKLNRKFFFIFDLQLNDLQGLAQSKKAALQFLDTQIQPTDEVSVCSYQARKGLKVHEYLNTDHKTITRAIEKLRGVPGSSVDAGPTGLKDESGGGLSLSASLRPPPPAMEDGILGPADSEENDLPTLRLNYVRIMTEFAKTLRYLPGYKNIVLFSAGLARSTVLTDKNLRDAYGDMGKEFGASSSPVFSVNSLGLRSYKMTPDERGDSSLKNLAVTSGGQYFANVSHAEKIASGIQSATGNYYVLGYYIDARWDGKFHEIKVKVKRPGCIVSTPIGYYNPKPFAELSEFEKQLQLMDLAFTENPRFQSPLELPSIVLPCGHESGTYLAFFSKLPSEGMNEITQQQIEAIVISVDQENNVIASKSGLIQIPDTLKKQVVCYSVIPAKTESQNCVMILRNTKTGKAARARGSASVSPPVLSGLELDPPLFLVPLDDGEVVYYGLTNKEKGAAGPPSLQQLFPFLSNRLKPVMGEISRETSRILAIVRCTDSSLPNAEIEVGASLKDRQEGADIHLQPVILDVNRQAKVDIFLLEFSLPELKAGVYTWAITGMNKKSRAKSTVSRIIRVF
jgi:VWFA-related protein